jgi:Family of unknown function (DUF6328)
MEEERRESLEEEATHATDEARMVLPGVQAILGFQLVAVFNQRFHDLTEARQVLHLVAFLFLALAMGLIMAGRLPSTGRAGCITRRFVDLASSLLTFSLVPLTVGIVIDTYLLAWLILADDRPSLGIAGALLLILVVLWFVVPQRARHVRKLARSGLRGAR